MALPADPWTRQNDDRLFLELLEQRRISVKEMITHVFPYRDAVKVYDRLMKDRTQALAVLLAWEG